MSQQCARDLLRGRSHQASGFCLIETVPWKRVRKSVCLLQRSPAVQERARAARYNIHSASAPDVLRPQRPSVIAPPIPPRHLKKRECRFSVGEGRKLTSTPVGAAKPRVESSWFLLSASSTAPRHRREVLLHCPERCRSACLLEVQYLLSPFQQPFF